MNIKVVTGENLFFAGRNLIQEIDCSDLNLKHYVLVPDRFSLQVENLIMDVKNLSSTFNIEVLGLSRLALRVLKELGVKGQTLNSDECLLLTEQAIQNVKHEFKSFKKCSVSFAQEVSKVISQFKSSRLAPEDIVAKGCSISIQNKYHDLGLIYGEYENLISGLYDANKLLALFSEHLIKENVLKDTYLYLVGFDSFTSEMFGIISTLAKTSRGVFIALPKAKNLGNEYIYEDDILNKLTELCKEENITIEVQEKTSALNAAQDKIIQNMFIGEVAAKEGLNYFQPIACQSLLQEVMTVGKLIATYVRKGGKFNEVMLACSDLEKYKPYFDRCFADLDIPYFADISVTADKLVMSSAIFAFLQVVSSHFSRESLLDYFSLPFLKNQNTSDLLEVIKAKNIHGAKRAFKNLSHLAKADLGLFEKLMNAKTCLDFCLAVKEFMTIYEECYKSFLECLQEEYAFEYNLNIQAVKNIEKAIDSIVKHQAGYQISIQEFVKKLRLLLSFNQVSSVPTFVDSVMIGDATTSYFVENKILFVLGGASVLPRSVQDNGLVSDNEIQSVNFIRKLEPTIRLLNRRNRFKLFNLLPLAKDKLFVTYCTVNSDGKKLEMPNFVTNLCNIFGEKPKPANLFFRSFDEEHDDNFIFGLGSKKNALNDYAGGQKSSYFSPRQLASLSKALKYDLGKLYLDREEIECDAQKLFFPKNYTKVTQLENYFSCPFKHFVSYGLKLDEPLSQEIDARDIGNICHKMAEIFVMQNLKSLGSLDDENIDKFVNANFKIVLESLSLVQAFEDDENSLALHDFVSSQCKVLLQRICYEQKYSSFKPIFTEKNLEGMSLEVEDKEISMPLQGKVDRIDTHEGYFRIIDYKTGRVDPLVKDLFYGDKLQLFIYQKNVAKMLGLASGGVFYFDAKFDFFEESQDSILKGLVAKDDQVISACDTRLGTLEKSDLINVALRAKEKDGLNYKGAICKSDFSTLQEYASRIASKAMGEIFDGYICPKPDEFSCDKCLYKGICLYDREKGYRKKSKVTEEQISKIIKGASDGKE